MDLLELGLKFFLKVTIHATIVEMIIGKIALSLLSLRDQIAAREREEL